MKRFYLTLLALVLSLSFATTYRELSLEEMLERTQVAFYGRVLQLETIDIAGEPWTSVTFEVLEPLVGIGEGVGDLSLNFYGGTLPSGDTLQVSLMPQFQVDENVLILAYDGAYYSPIVGFRQGLWRETARGFVSETSSILSLDDDETLSLDGAGASNADLLRILKDALVTP